MSKKKVFEGSYRIGSTNTGSGEVVLEPLEDQGAGKNGNHLARVTMVFPQHQINNYQAGEEWHITWEKKSAPPEKK